MPQLIDDKGKKLLIFNLDSTLLKEGICAFRKAPVVVEVLEHTSKSSGLEPTKTRRFKLTLNNRTTLVYLEIPWGK